MEKNMETTIDGLGLSIEGFGLRFGCGVSCSRLSNFV